MLAKRKLRQLIPGLFLGVLFTAGAPIGAEATPSRWTVPAGANPFSAVWTFIAKVVELVLPPVEVDFEGGYIDPDGRS